MLNPFPQLLVFSFFAPTLLRVAVAIVFFLTALRFTRERKALAHSPAPFIGSPGIALVFFAILVYAGLGLMLLFGWNTQIAALLGALGSLKQAWLAGHWKMWAHHSRAAYLLLAVMCISLLLTGAGAFAMDLPL